jgi:predicted ATPase
MLKSFRVDNFKSLVNLAFEPAGLNLLVGSNNAGKTNLCHALRFLSLTSKMPVNDAAAECTPEPWNLLNVYISSQSLTMAAVCELNLDGELLTFTYELTLVSQKAPTRPVRRSLFAVSKEILRISGGRFTDTILLENTAGQVRLLHEKRFLRDHGSGDESPYVDTTAPVDTTMLCRLYDLETNQRSNLFKRYLATWGYYSFEPSCLRNKTARRSRGTLEGDGSNLMSVLFNVHNSRPRLARKLIEATRLMDPRLDLFSFANPDPDHVYMFFEDRRGNKFGVDSVSDGTLRHLAMSYLVFSAGDDPDQAEGSPLIMIEEPENGIFVGHLREVFEKIEPSGRRGQFLFTSHNPYFIDLFDSALDGLFLVKGGEIYSSLIKPDRAKLSDRLGKFSLGEMHFRGLLE